MFLFSSKIVAAEEKSYQLSLPLLARAADTRLLQALNAGFLRPGSVILVVLDGFGIGNGNPEEDAIAAYLAQNPDSHWGKLLRSPKTLKTQLTAHGPAVGLPGDDDMGNSEVGHNAIGAGRLIEQGAKVIQNLIRSGQFYELEQLQSVILHVLEKQSTLHLMGLLQESGVHAHIDHVKALVEAAARKGVQKIRLHILSDGRDDSPEKTVSLMQDLLDYLETFNRTGKDYRVASGGGRMWMTMDRYGADWKMVERGWNTVVHGDAELQVSNPLDGIVLGRQQSHTNNPKDTDQFLPSYVVMDERGPIGKMSDKDAVIFWNFRGDRSIEISEAFESEDFSHFDRGQRPKVIYAGMMLYDGDSQTPRTFLVPMPKIVSTMGEIMAHNGLSVLAGAETQKFGHITYFINGNNSGKFDDKLETYIEVASEDASLFREHPVMKASEVTNRIFFEAVMKKPKFIRINYANADMVGHTGDFEATVAAIRAVDEEIGRLVNFINQSNGILVITADHGNADEMIKKGKASTSHSINPVPLVIYDPNYQGEYQMNSSIKGRKLAHVAPTIFNLGGYRSPDDMEPSLIIFGG